MSKAGSQVTTYQAPRPIVSLVGSDTLADRRDVAAFFGKQHRHVLEAIRGAKCSPAFRAANFRPFEINDLQGTSTSHVLMTKNGFSFVVLAFTGERAARFREEYIEAFDAMEAEFRRRHVFDPNDPAALRVTLLGYTEKLIEARTERDEARMEAAIAKEEVLLAAPKLEAYEALLDDQGCCSLATAARILGGQQTPWFVWLRKTYVFDTGESVLPVAKYRTAGHFRVRLVKARPGQHREQTLVTRQGLIWLGHRWQAHLAREARDIERNRIQGELGI